VNNGELSGMDIPVITIIKDGLKITKVTSTLGFIKPELTQSLAGSSYNVSLTFDKAALQGRRVSTNCGSGWVLRN
jgi:hypothetical protein